MQWILDTIAPFLGGGGLLVGTVGAVTWWIRRSKAAIERDTALAPKLLDRVAALEAKDADATGRFAVIRAELDACRDMHAECTKRDGAKLRAIELLARELERRTTPPGRR